LAHADSAGQSLYCYVYVTLGFGTVESLSR
jgi:hypothetical protein